MISLTWEKDLPCKRAGVQPHFEKRFAGSDLQKLFFRPFGPIFLGNIVYYLESDVYIHFSLKTWAWKM